jgi:F-box protein 11
LRCYLRSKAEALGVHETDADRTLRDLLETLLIKTALHQTAAVESMLDEMRDTMSAQLEALRTEHQLTITALREQLAHTQESMQGLQQELSATREPSRPGPALVICPHGTGDYRTIGAAIEAAPPGTRLLIRPGRYLESLRLVKHLELQGDGPAAEIILESPDGHCIEVRTHLAVLRGLSIIRRAGSASKGHAVYIPQGRPVVEDCSITSASLACVFVEGSDTAAMIRRSRVHGGAEAGVYVTGRARASLLDSQIHENSGPGIAAALEGECALQRCWIASNGSGGIAITDRSSVSMMGCDISWNDNWGVLGGHGSRLIIEGCRIYSNRSEGLKLHQNSSALLTGSSIYENRGIGLTLLDQADMVMDGCRVYSGQNVGVSVADNARASLIDCKVFLNQGHGVIIGSGGTVRLAGCTICDGQAIGLYVYEAGHQTVVQDCEIRNNQGGGVSVAGSGNPVMRRCTVHSSGSSGIIVWPGGVATVENCEVDRHARAGIETMPGTEITLKDCRIRENRAYGVSLADNTRGHIEGSRVLLSLPGPWLVGQGCHLSCHDNVPPVPERN